MLILSLQTYFLSPNIFSSNISVFFLMHGQFGTFLFLSGGSLLHAELGDGEGSRFLFAVNEGFLSSF